MPDEHLDRAEQRLTLRLILRELAERFFSLESGWLRTARELFVCPGPMIRRYIEGERKSYANPFAYVLVGTAIGVLVQKSISFETWMAEISFNPNLNPGQTALIQDLQRLMMQHMLYQSLGILIPFALFLRLFFRRSGYNLAEMAVFALYTIGHTSLFGVVLMPLCRLFDIHPGFVGVPVLLIYLAYAGISFFGGRVFTLMKTCISIFCGFITYMIVVYTATIIYIIGFKLDTIRGGEDWNMVSATEQGVAPMIQSLIDKGEDVDLTLQRTPLHIAAEKGDLEIVELLLAGGADVDARDFKGQVPALVALRQGHREVALRLFEAGADPLATSATGSTLLMAAARTADLDLMRWLLDNGAEINARRSEGKHLTALMWAADRSSAAMVELLLEYGADPSVTNEEGETALDMADSDEIADLLRAAEARPSGGDPEQNPDQ